MYTIGIIPTCIGIIPTCIGIIPTCIGIAKCIGIIPTCIGIIPPCIGIIPTCTLLVLHQHVLVCIEYQHVLVSDIYCQYYNNNKGNAEQKKTDNIYYSLYEPIII